MEVKIGEVATFPSAQADAFQAAKILEESAEVFAAWQEYDAKGRAMYRKPFLRKLLNELADLMMACANMRSGLGVEQVPVRSVHDKTLSKSDLVEILEAAARLFSATGDYLLSLSAFGENAKSRSEALELRLDRLERTACFVIASLGVEDFTPYMQACEKRNRWRGRYE